MLNMLAYGCSARIGAGYPRDEVDDAAGGSEVDDDAQGKEQSERYGVTWWMVENSSCHIDCTCKRVLADDLEVAADTLQC